MYNILLFALKIQQFASGQTVGCTDGASHGSVNVPTSDPTYCNNFTTGLPTSSAAESTLQTALKIGFGIIGAVAVIYIMYAAFRFLRSQGDPQQVAQARNTILYAVIGLAVALLAELIVTATLGRL